MSIAFTSPYNWPKGLQDTDCVNEIVRALRERSRAAHVTFNDNWPANIVVGARAARAVDMAAWQSWLEGGGGNEWGNVSGYPSFVDHVNGPLNSAGDDFLFFTKAAWQQAAGLNVSDAAGGSFRRAVEIDLNGDPVFLYGFCQAGDIYGPWVFEDIQKGLSALKWVAFPTVSDEAGFGFPDWELGATGYQRRLTSDYLSWVGRADAYSKAVNAFEALEWADYTPGWAGGSAGNHKACGVYKFRSCDIFGVCTIGYYCAVESKRYKHKVSVPYFCGRSVQGWIKAAYPPSLAPTFGNAPRYYEFDDNGDFSGDLLRLQKYTMFYDSEEISTDPEFTSDYFINNEVPNIAPAIDDPPEYPDPMSGYVVVGGWSQETVKFLIKYDFTNA